MPKKKATKTETEPAPDSTITVPIVANPTVPDTVPEPTGTTPTRKS